MNEAKFEKSYPKDRLYQVLLEEVSAYDYLNEILRDKQRAIVQNDLKKIEHLNGIEQMLITKASHLTQFRSNLLTEYFLQKNVSEDESTLGNFIGELPQDERTSWDRLNKRLNKISHQIQRTNRENVRLIDASLSHIRSLITMFLPRDENGKHIYTEAGNEDHSIGTKNLLDCNA